jgi:hypothetical protein
MGTPAVPLNLQAAQKGKAMNETTAQDRPAKQPSPRRGRRTKYTPEVVKLICQMISRGLNYCQAADAAGIHRDTLHEWERQKPAFSDALKRAKASGVDRRLKRIERAAAKGAWQADAWWLERNHPETWGRKSRETAEEQAAAEAAAAAKRAKAEAQQLDWSLLTDDELAIVEPLLEKASGRGPEARCNYLNFLTTEEILTMNRLVTEGEERMAAHARQRWQPGGFGGVPGEGQPETSATSSATPHAPAPP